MNQEASSGGSKRPPSYTEEFRGQWMTIGAMALAESVEWTNDRVRRELFEYIEADYNRSRASQLSGGTNHRWNSKK